MHVVEAGHGDGGDVVVVQRPDGKPEPVSLCPAGAYVEGEQAFPLTNRQTPPLCSVVHLRNGPALGWTRGLRQQA